MHPDSQVTIITKLCEQLDNTQQHQEMTGDKHKHRQAITDTTATDVVLLINERMQGCSNLMQTTLTEQMRKVKQLSNQFLLLVLSFSSGLS